MNTSIHETDGDQYVTLDAKPIVAPPGVIVAVRPEYHACPVCRRHVTHAATLCGFCWTRRGSGRDQPDQRRANDQ